MNLEESISKYILTFRYPVKDSKYLPTGLCFIVEDGDFMTSYKNAGYWKIGIVLRNVDSGVKWLRSQGVQVSRDPRQFLDIGYLTSLTDPNGYSIELLQETFDKVENVDSDESGTMGQIAGYIPHIGQITIRCRNKNLTDKFYRDVLGMRLMCYQRNPELPFTLYFYAYTADIQPNEHDLNSVENRPWLYQKPYCQIEVVHNHSCENVKYCVSDGVSDGVRDVRIGHVGFSVVVEKEMVEKSAKILQDPDGYDIEVKCCDAN